MLILAEGIESMMEVKVWHGGIEAIPSYISNLEAESRQEVRPGSKNLTAFPQSHSSSSEAPPPNGSRTFSNCTTNWAPSVRFSIGKFQTTTPTKSKLREQGLLWVTLRGDTVHHGRTTGGLWLYRIYWLSGVSVPSWLPPSPFYWAWDTSPFRILSETSLVWKCP